MKSCNRIRTLGLSAAAALLALAAACGPSAPTTSESAAKSASGPVPTFTLAWSEYPSWSAFGVASEVKLIDGRKGEMGPIEQKWEIDIELKEADYDTCNNLFGSQKVDAACLTNMDGLVPSETVKTVAILPTSTSFGADACIVTKDIASAEQLKGRKVYGLVKSVSEYAFVRNLEKLGLSEKDFTFSNMDPAAAATQMQQKQAGVEAIMVWNPFVLETLNKRDDVRVLFDSTQIPNEIIDMVLMAQQSLDRPGGDKFACAVIDTFYELNKRLADPATHDATLVALGQKFSHLDLQSMTKVVEQTRFYGTPEAGLEVLKGEATKGIMQTVAKFCLDHQVIGREAKVGYGSQADAPDAMFRFDPTFIQRVLDRK